MEAQQGRVMGRRPSNPNAIPRLRIRERKHARWYYYDHGIVKGKRELEPLGRDYARAIQKWAALEGLRKSEAPTVLTFKHVAEQYRIDEIPKKAPRTQHDNGYELAHLLAFFDDPPCLLEAIEPQHVQQYMRWRKDAPIRATREKALLSHIWNYARREGFTKLANPCAGIEGTATGRDVYVEDDEYALIYAQADQVLRDCMDLAYLTGQRPADALKITMQDVRAGVIHVKQNKTKHRERIEIVGELATVVERVRARKLTYAVLNSRLIVNEGGRMFGVNALSRRFRKAADAAGLPALQFRDLRAKAATDKLEGSGDITQAQRLLGHSSARTTENYIRARRGRQISPVR